MKRGKIIVVEGPSNSGKTTTCQNMKAYENCVVIDECMIYEKNPPEPSQNYEQEILNQIFFFEVERRRMKKATSFALEGKNVILDRCALSTVAISYAFEKLGKYPTFKYALKQYEELFYDESFLKPDEYIFLHTNNDSTIQRNETRENKLSESWIDNCFTKYQNEFYEIVSQKIPNSKIISTAGKDKEYVSKIIAETLKVKKLSEKDMEK